MSIGSSRVIQLTASNVSPRYFLHTSGDKATQDIDQRGVGIVLSGRAEATLLDWISVSSYSLVRCETVEISRRPGG